MTKRKWFIFRNILEQRPIEYQLARFHLMQQISHLFYTMAFLLPGFVGQADRLECEPCPNSGTIIGACGRGKSTWRTKR